MGGMTSFSSEGDGYFVKGYAIGVIWFVVSTSHPQGVVWELLANRGGGFYV